MNLDGRILQRGSARGVLTRENLGVDSGFYVIKMQTKDALKSLVIKL